MLKINKHEAYSTYAFGGIATRSVVRGLLFNEYIRKEDHSQKSLLMQYHQTHKMFTHDDNLDQSLRKFYSKRF